MVGSDSGAIVILRYDQDQDQMNENDDQSNEKNQKFDKNRKVPSLSKKGKNRFHQVQMQTFGRTGIRRMVPGQFVASDPHGRTIMIASMDKQKFAYILSRELETGKMIMSSPLEAHKNNRICTAFISLDSGYENPLYASIEIEYEPNKETEENDNQNQNDQEANASPSTSSPHPLSNLLPSKEIMIYEVDLGLNHVVRRWSDPIEPSSNLLIPIIGGDEGPGGVLICSENKITYLKPLQIQRGEGHDRISITIPKRNATLASTFITSGSLVKARTGYFYLLQSELGDLFKLVLKTNMDSVSTNESESESESEKIMEISNKKTISLSLRYFDTIPLCSNIAILRSGFLFAPSEYTDNYFYQFHSLGDHEDEMEWTSFNSNSNNDSNSTFNSIKNNQNENENNEIETDSMKWTFTPRNLRNLALVDKMENYSEMTDGMVMNLMPNTEVSPQIFMAHGRGNQSSSFNIIRHGMGIGEDGEIASLDISLSMAKSSNSSNLSLSNLSPLGSNINCIGICYLDNSISLVSTVNSTIPICMENGIISLMEQDRGENDHLKSLPLAPLYGFTRSLVTIDGGLMADGSFVQIIPTGLIQIRNNRVVFEWKNMMNMSMNVVTLACINSRQVVLYLDGNRSIVYLELEGNIDGNRNVSGISNQFLPLREVKSISGLPERVQSMTLSPILKGEKRARFLALGCMDNVIRMLGLNPGECLEPLSLQPLASRPLSMTLVRMRDHLVDPNHAILYLFIGLENGVLVWMRVDYITGMMENAITRYLGPKPITFISRQRDDGVNVRGGGDGINKTGHDDISDDWDFKSNIVVVCSEMKSWIVYSSRDTCSLAMTPINYDRGIRRAIPIASPFTKETMEGEEGGQDQKSKSTILMILTMDNQVKLLQMEDPNIHFYKHAIPLPRTPKRVIFSSELGLFGFLCSENYSFDQGEIDSIMKSYDKANCMNRMNNANDEHDNAMSKLEIEIRAPKNQWTSEVILYDPFKGEFSCSIKMNRGEVALCASFISFHDKNDNTNDEHDLGKGVEMDNNALLSSAAWYLAIGVSTGFTQLPQKKSTSNSIHLYRIKKRSKGEEISTRNDSNISNENDNNLSLSIELVHKTTIEGIPTCMSSFGGRLLVGIDRIMRMYDCGKARLLRKCEVKLPTTLTSIQSQGWRIVVGDSWEGIHFIYYRAKENQFLVFCDDTIPRRMTHSMIMLDFDTAAGSDKFGNFFIVRVPSSISEEAELDTLSISQSGRQEYFFGAGIKLDHLADFYLGDVIVMMQKVSLVHGQKAVILYVTILGAIGVFIPFASRESALSMQNLEGIMRSERDAILAARNHLSYRSSFQPARSIIDGDLIETFLGLNRTRQDKIAKELEQDFQGITREIRELRSICGFY